MEIKKQTVSKTEEVSITFERVAPAEIVNMLPVLASSMAGRAKRTKNKEEREWMERYVAAMLSAVAYIQERETKEPSGGGGKKMRFGAKKYRLLMAELDNEGLVCSINRVQHKHFEVYINYAIIKVFKKRESANKYIARLHKLTFMKKVYIGGKVTGLPRHQATQLFGTLEKKLQEQGYETVVPLNLVESNMEWQAAMRICIAKLMECDELHLLPNWQDSNGARLERDIAQRLGMNIVYH